MSGLHNPVPSGSLYPSDDDEAVEYHDVPVTWEDFVNVEVQEKSFHDDLKDFLYSFQYSSCEETVARREAPLFEGSSFSVTEFSRFIQQLKSSNPGIGDRLISSIIGTFASFLPAGNGVAELLKPRPSMYRVLRVFHNATGMVDDMRTYSIHT